MVHAVYLASLAGQDEPVLLYSRSFAAGLPTKTSALDTFCAYNSQGVDSIPAESEEDPHQLMRVYEGNDVLDAILSEGKNEFLKASNQSTRKEKKKDFASGTFPIKDTRLMVHWMSSLKGTALMMIASTSANASIVRSNMRSILTSLAARIRLDQPRDVFLKAHVVSLTLKYYLPCGQLLLHPTGMTKQIDGTIAKLLK
ncbi:uncharacterized protein LOC100897547 [Galendromus occidentalis]|uniref:Uncharacterized protein LOC100897547 n=1 Tax=Galendromus occidentalis TaxID=34638 RepID=A0AAJ6VYU7_9ACAR|nr:uncharacterized protein LOC100897547 [Galendromus occidentalis]